MFACSNCGGYQDESRFGADLIIVANQKTDTSDPIGTLDQLPGWAFDKAIDESGFDGKRESFCASCYWDVRVIAAQIIDRETAPTFKE